MYILGKTKLQGEEKDILLKEEDNFFKYYSLELLGVYSPKTQQKIIFKKDLNISENTKENIIELFNKKNIEQVELELLGEIDIYGEKKEILLKKEEKFFRFYYLNLIGVYSFKMPGNTIIFREDTIENVVIADAKDNIQKKQITPTEKEEIEQFLEKVKVLDIIQRLQTKQRGINERTQYNRTIRKNETIKEQERQNTINKNRKNELEMRTKTRNEDRK